MKAVQIAASVLSCDFAHLAKELSRASDANLFHLDIMDGHYVPNLTFGQPLVAKIRQLTKLPLDAHLMVTNPEDYVAPFAHLGVNWFSFHQECVYHSHRVVQHIKSLGMKAGIALNPATPLSTLDSILPDLDYVLLMSVNPGFSGQEFIPSTLEKINQLKDIITQNALPTLIEVDGGINETNASLVIAAGADILVSASYIFSSKDYGAAIKSLRNN
ncbi:MAG: ribulose-phosphate 3-epimerase [Candidatus Cloacimonadaceae bacterium]|jgi:ribulose-phosphate 3-epimerase|nr:ribulose-phosphate 3-epimerase [Candidatus Cloacimonadota bacterium]MCB5257914.1 ribulose-phosphate 3-epimerase [Candidatus Cloacimonadota bacterium]MDD5624389.1 ribulose-phosphate 3-epimerase [Candidatus Cloacimonadota bacterium]MDY0112011.1 ribulose-phosphate 3-epimerase [Candidatus Syntrophosphaera sp.]